MVGDHHARRPEAVIIPREVSSAVPPVSAGTPPPPASPRTLDSVCPVCGAEVEQHRCKVVCTRCRAVVMSCAEF